MTQPARLLVGRERERSRIAAFVAALPRGLCALIVRGEPGIAKTALWRAGVDDCVAAGCTVLLSRLAEEEMPLGLTGLVDLFERHDADAGAPTAAENPFARGRAVLAALRRLSAAAPVVLALDDLQWLDHASGRALRYALRRLDREPVGVLATVREGRQADDPLALAATLPAGRTEALSVGPLGLEELRGLLVDSISRPALQRIHAVSGGNPLYALELARGATAAGLQPGGLALPVSLRAAIADRLETVGDDVAELLQAVSALGHTTVAELSAALPGRDVAALLAQAEARGLLVVEEDLRVRFGHPLVGSVVYGTMRPLARRALHARLAAAAGGPDVRARHLALSTDVPDAASATLLEEAADRARAREAFDLAADFAAHSARLTPPHDRAAALRRRLAEIDDRAIAGELSRALALADRLVASLEPGPERCEALLERA